MGDGRALQAGTSHNLGQNFAMAFDTTFANASGEREHVWQTSWGMSTRMIGGIIMQHGDDMGLRLPPKMAPYQVVVVPILQADETINSNIMATCEKIMSFSMDAGFRATMDDREKLSPGFKYNYWEMKGVPIRVEVGPKDILNNSCLLARRDMPGKQGKTAGVPVRFDVFSETVHNMLNEIQEGMLKDAQEKMNENIVDVASLDELKEVVSSGKWARCGWDGSDEDELLVKEQTSATIRCFPLDQPSGKSTCIVTGKSGVDVCLFAKSY